MGWGRGLGELLFLLDPIFEPKRRGSDGGISNISQLEQMMSLAIIFDSTPV